MATPFLLSRIGISAKSAITALLYPHRQDMVAALGETTGLRALERMRDNMLMDTGGRRILRMRPIINSTVIDLSKLSKSNPSSFGFAYAKFLEINNVSPDTRLEVKYIGDPELAYVMTRYRQVHDFWHTLVQLPISVEAEIGLKMFEFFQTGLPMAALSGIFGPLNLTPDQRRVFYDVYLPWSIQCANTSVNLMNVMYEDYFETPLVDLQKELGLCSCPSGESTLQEPRKI